MTKKTPWTYRNGSRIYLDGSEVAQISFATGRLKEGRERARFIVHACNCHDELVEALKHIKSEYGYCLPEKTMQKINKALAKAESINLADDGKGREADHDSDISGKP